MKPVFEINVSTMDNKRTQLNALFDSGSFYTIIREDILPSKKFVYPMAESFGTASKGGKLPINGGTVLIIEYEGRSIKIDALISPILNQDMIIGAGAMQTWDIDIQNKKGKSKVIFRKDMHDSDITSVL